MHTVIGGSGFIGTELVRQLLAAGHKVRIADKTRSSTYPGSLDLRGRA